MSNEIKPSTKEMSNLIAKEMKLGANGIIEISADTFIKSLEGTGITEANVKAIQKHNAEFFAASMDAAGSIAIPAMKKDKKLDQVSVEIPVLKDSISHVIMRSKEVMSGMPKEGGERETKTTYGYVSSRFVTDVTGAKGEAKKARKAIAEQAALAFGKS